MTGLAQTAAADKPMPEDTAALARLEAALISANAPSHPPDRLFHLNESDSFRWWQHPWFVSFWGALGIVLWIGAGVVGGMAVVGFFAAPKEEPNEPPTVEVVILGSVGDGYQAGMVGRKEGTATQPNLRRDLPAASSPQPQPSKPQPPAPPLPTMPAQPTQLKPVVKPTQPQPQPTFPKPQPTKPVEKELVAKNAPTEKVLIPPPPVQEKPKSTAPAPTQPVETRPKEQPRSPPAVATAPPSQNKPSQPPTSVVASNGVVGAVGSESSKGDSDHNGTGRRRGTRGSGGEGDGVDPPDGFYNPAPFYPSAAQAEGRQGTVVLWLRIGTDGYVESIRVHQTSGYSDLDEAALATVRRWRFNPARNKRTREPQASEHTVPIHFVIRQ